VPNTHARKLASTAYHEAGHVALALEFELKLKRATIKPDAAAGSLGGVHHHKIGAWFRPDLEVNARIEQRIFHEIMSSLAGVVAEKTFTGKRANHGGAVSDYGSAADLAMYLAGNESETNALLKWLGMRVERIIKHRWDHVVRPIAEALIERQTLSQAEIYAVLKAHSE
jgi:hypothetical protein